MIREQAVAGGALVEIERLAPPQHRNSRHLDTSARSLLTPRLRGGLF
jgi:hypothetical protein